LYIEGEEEEEGGGGGDVLSTNQMNDDSLIRVAQYYSHEIDKEAGFRSVVVVSNDRGM